MTLDLHQVSVHFAIVPHAGPDRVQFLNFGNRSVTNLGWYAFAYCHWVDVEAYLSRAFGFALLAVATLTILLTGSIPLVSSVGDVDATTTTTSTEGENARAPYAVPTLLVTTLFQATLAIYDYTWYLANGKAALGLGMVGSAAVASLGVWCLLFATSQGRVSRRTGADKRTSGFPFRNAEADKRHPERKRL
jgi:hypothetical protein